MDKQQLQELEKELTREEATIIRQLKDVSIENPSIKGDFEPVMPSYNLGDNTIDDRVNEATDFDRNFAMEQQLEKRLKEIQDVRKQITEGTYGQCTSCASPIASERLQAIPTATLCMNCAQKA
ncbi:MAG: TraR/DksA C4-type zinc finger protein [Patescibacteria group bacterium]